MGKQVFNQRNPLGKRCVWALIPGWTHLDYIATDIDPRQAIGMSTLGQVHGGWEAESDGTGNERLVTVRRDYGPGIGKATAMLFEQNDATAFTRFIRHTNDLGIIFPNPKELTIVSICKPTGDGRPINGSSGDPRLYTKDEGTAEVDHDLMIGFADFGTEARTRIRVGGSTATAITTGNVIQNDALNLVAGTVEILSGNDVYIKAHHLGENGTYSKSVAQTKTGSYDPRTTTNMALGGSAATSLENAFNGEILGVWAFDGAFDEADCRALMANPWQVFKPQRFLIPMTDTVVEIAEEGPATTVFITDVNGTESWTDGDTGLVITGSGFV